MRREFICCGHKHNRLECYLVGIFALSRARARARTALYTWKSNDKIAFIHHYQVRWVCFGSAHVAAIMYTRVLYVRECDLFENFCNWKVFFVHFPTFFSFGSTVIFQPLYTHYDEMIYMHCTTIYISRTTSMFDVLVSYIHCAVRIHFIHLIKIHMLSDVRTAILFDCFYSAQSVCLFPVSQSDQTQVNERPDFGLKC